MSITVPDFDVRLDPTQVASSRTELKLNDGPIRIDQSGMDWGDAAIQAYMADMLVGSAAVDYRLPNRNVIIPLFVGADESDSFDRMKIQLMNKVARFQREGGWVKRQAGLYGDVVNATLTFPDVWGEPGGFEPNVVLNLECLPDFYGDEIALDPFTATPASPGLAAIANDTLFGPLQLSGQQAFIRGDHPARCRLVVANGVTGANANVLGLLWGLRSRYSDPSGTARLSYRATDLTAVNGTIATSGAMRNNSLTPNTWMAILTTTIAALPGTPAMTHRGSYRVWARVLSPTAPQLRFLWGVGSLSAPTYNDPVTIPVPAVAGQFVLVDLGEIRLDAPPVGPMQWLGAIQAFPDSGLSVTVDQLWLQPLDDNGGRLIWNPSTPPSTITATAGPTAAGDNATVGTMTWTGIGNVTTQDNNPATISFTATGQATHYIAATGFNFAIPAPATILGIAATVYRKESVAGSCWDNSVKMATTGTQEKAYGLSSWGTGGGGGFGNHVYGGPTDLWGGVWTPALINAGGFGLLFSAKGNSVIATPGVGSVDYIAITVYYTLASGVAVATDAVIYAATATANQINCEMRTEGMYRNDPTGAVYGEVSRVIGDLPRLPTSGMEKRPVEVFVKVSPGDLGSLVDGSPMGISQIQAYYRPSYLFPP